MRSGVVLLLVSAAALSLLSAAAGAPSSRGSTRPPSRSRTRCTASSLSRAECWRCKPGGAIAVTSDGGKTWRITQHTSQRIIGLGFFHDRYYVELNGGVLPSGQRFSFRSHCPKRWKNAGISADIVDPTSQTVVALHREGGGGFMAKAVYRGSKRVAFTTPWLPPKHNGHGEIDASAVPAGIAGGVGGFGIIWPSGRGPAYVTRTAGTTGRLERLPGVG